MSYKSIIIRLYYLLIYADGHVNEKEISMGDQMKTFEGIAEDEFSAEMTTLKSMESAYLYPTCIAALKKLDRKQQIRCIAWLCVIANADGFMDKKEWQFIYNIYHRELRLPLEEIMNVQKSLLKEMHSVSQSGTMLSANSENRRPVAVL